LGVNMDVPVLDVLPVSVAFYETTGKSGAKVDQANSATNTFETDTTHFSAAGAEQQCRFVVECLMHATNSSLAALQKAVNHQALRSPTAPRSLGKGVDGGEGGSLMSKP